MPERKIAKLERLKISDDITARFFIRPGSRSRPWTWFEADEVPPFEEEIGWFELERERGHGWKVVRQVPKPAWER
ncbi:hypothetical protein DFR49_0773 [Hephaestia caeni]|uniref:Uncharacterized protein n=1 Tax=Hephaestia caeni TaxID=645617 RepID=A0A397P9L1_9SPHN|nr:hypothetical protein [Hephaestia caeni]RIA46240.1 hypothetical protein DFR49_0773 [Hephaestia caeni]